MFREGQTAIRRHTLSWRQLCICVVGWTRYCSDGCVRMFAENLGPSAPSILQRALHLLTARLLIQPTARDVHYTATRRRSAGAEYARQGKVTRNQGCGVDPPAPAGAVGGMCPRGSQINKFWEMINS